MTAKLATSDALSVAALIISILTFIFNVIWTPLAKLRWEQIKLAAEFKRKYIADHQQHLDTLYALKSKASKDLAYATLWQSGMAPGLPQENEAKKIDNARRMLGCFWDDLLDAYESRMLPKRSSLSAWLSLNSFLFPKDMLSGKFLRKATDYQKLVEPLECANWYVLGIYKETGKDGREKGDYSLDHPQRPSRYILIEAKCSKDYKSEWHKKLSALAQTCREQAETTL